MSIIFVILKHDTVMNINVYFNNSLLYNNHHRKLFRALQGFDVKCYKNVLLAGHIYYASPWNYWFHVFMEINMGLLKKAHFKLNQNVNFYSNYVSKLRSELVAKSKAAHVDFSLRHCKLEVEYCQDSWKRALISNYIGNVGDDDILSLILVWKSLGQRWVIAEGAHC